MLEIYAITGCMFSGKDHVIKQMGLPNISMSDPIHAVVKHLYGSTNKSRSGIRAAMQVVGRWGRGDILPYNLEGAAQLKEIRGLSPEFDDGRWSFVNWYNFGNPNFWIHIVEDRIERQLEQPSNLLPNLRACIISSIRWPNELAWAKQRGAIHVHVTCHEETLWKRRAEAQYWAPQSELSDPSEAMAHQIDAEKILADITVWNDEEAPKAKNNYLTVAEFLCKLASDSNGVV